MKRFVLVCVVLCSVPYAALYFDNDADYVGVPDHADFTFTGAFTVSAWVKVAVVDAEDVIVSHMQNSGSEAWFLSGSSTGSGRFLFRVYYEGSAQSVETPDGSVSGDWQHVVAVREADNDLRIYYDGNGPYGANSLAGTIDSTGTLYIGRYNLASNWFHGDIADVAIWNVELTKNEMDRITQAGMFGIPQTIQPSNLMGYWKLIDREPGTAATGDTVRDRSGRGHDGTVTSSSNWTADRLGHQAD